MFINRYHCPRYDQLGPTPGRQCDDDCPACGCRHITPIDSDDDGEDVPDEEE